MSTISLCNCTNKTYSETYQISDIGNLYSVMDDFGACTAIPSVEHGLIDDERRLDVLRGLANVAPAPIECPQISVVPPPPCSVFSFFPVVEKCRV